MLCGGPGDRDAFARSAPRAPRSRDLSFLPIDALAAAIAQVQLLVACDSGPVHLATAVGTPALALFGPPPRRAGARRRPGARSRSGSPARPARTTAATTAPRGITAASAISRRTLCSRRRARCSAMSLLERIWWSDRPGGSRGGALAAAAPRRAAFRPRPRSGARSTAAGLRARARRGAGGLDRYSRWAARGRARAHSVVAPRRAGAPSRSPRAATARRTDARMVGRRRPAPRRGGGRRRAGARGAPPAGVRSSAGRGARSSRDGVCETSARTRSSPTMASSTAPRARPRRWCSTRRTRSARPPPPRRAEPGAARAPPPRRLVWLSRVDQADAPALAALRSSPARRPGASRSSRATRRSTSSTVASRGPRTRRAQGPAWPPPRRIARPGGFRRTLAALGAEVAAGHLFPDHHPFTPGELERALRARTGRASSPRRRTPVRLAPRPRADPRVRAVRIDAEILRGDEVLDAGPRCGRAGTARPACEFPRPRAAAPP